MNSNKYQTILVISLGFLAIGLFIDTDWPYYVAFGIGTLALLSDKIAKLIVQLWFGLANILGYINSRILLSIIYYLILVPFALLGRLSKSKALILKKQEGSYFTTRDHLFEKADFEKPW